MMSPDVFCVFFYESGASFLEKVFSNRNDAQSYIEAQPQRYRTNYSMQTWEVE